MMPLGETFQAGEVGLVLLCFSDFLLQVQGPKGCPGVRCEDNEENLPFLPGAAVQHTLTKKNDHF